MTVTKTNRAIGIKLETSTPRLWTPRRTASGSLTIGADTYLHFDVAVDRVVRAAENQPVIACQLRIGNVEGLASFLVLDTTEQQVPVTITRAKLDTDGSVLSSEIWFAGRTGRPAFDGQYVTLDCRIDTGRRGRAKLRKRVNLMINHRPPEPGTQILFRTLEVG